MKATPKTADESRNALAFGQTRLLVSDEELADLTGTLQPKRQRQWLDQRRWPYATTGGRIQRPRVARAVFDARMQGRDAIVAAAEPRFEALDSLRRDE